MGLYRQHCTLMYNGLYFKDMRRLGRDLEKAVIIDNSPLALGLTPENGIVCSSWFGDETGDEELLHLYDVLRQCCASPSISDLLASRYGLASWMANEREAFAAVFAKQQAGIAAGPQMFAMPFM